MTMTGLLIAYFVGVAAGFVASVFLFWEGR